MLHRSSKFSSQSCSQLWRNIARKLQCLKTCLFLLRNSKYPMRVSRLKQKLTIKKMPLRLSLNSFKTRLLTSKNSFTEVILAGNSNNNSSRTTSFSTNSNFSITTPRLWPMLKLLSRWTSNCQTTVCNSLDSTNHCKCFLTWDRQPMKSCHQPIPHLTMLWAKSQSLRLAAFSTSGVSMSIQVSMSRCHPCILIQRASSTQYCSSRFRLKDYWASMEFNNNRPVLKRARLIVTSAQLSTVMANQRQLLTSLEKCLRVTMRHLSKRFAAIKTK